MAKNNTISKVEAEEAAYGKAHGGKISNPVTSIGPGGDPWPYSSPGPPGSITDKTPGGDPSVVPGGGTTPPATTTPTTTPTKTPTKTPDGLSLANMRDIINAALQIVGLDPNQVAAPFKDPYSGAEVTPINSGQTLTDYFISVVQAQGLTDSASIGDMVSTMLPATGQFQQAFPGYQASIKAGYVRTVAQYVTAEEGITATMLQGGIPKDLINPVQIGGLIMNGVSTNEVAARVNQGYDAVQNAPAEVQNYFSQEFGANGPQALATVFLNPHIDDLTLNKMLAGAQIRGAAAASNLTISQGLSQRFADQGQTYASAQAKFQSITNQAGLFQQTVGEQSSQQGVPGTQNMNAPLTASNQGVGAAFGTNANDVQQVHQAALARENSFRGTGGASSTQAEGYSGLSVAKGS